MLEMAGGEGAASEEARRTLRYVEPLNDATCLRESLRRRQETRPADFFSILLALLIVLSVQ
jgi:hypothetical protein